jgi:hypothetical protein
MATELYLQTTNPKLELHQLFSTEIFAKMVASVCFHTAVYTGFLNLVNYVFFGAALSSRVNARLVGVLLVIMFFGYIARFYHVKDISRAYNNDANKTRNHLDKLFIGWIFVA